MTITKVSILAVAIAIIVTALIPENAKAEGGYAGAHYTIIDGGVVDFTGVTFRGGYSFNDFVSMEGRYTMPTGGRKVHGVKYELDYVIGAYLVLTLPITDEFNPYFIVGHSENSITSSTDRSRTFKDQSTSTGFGVKYQIRENWTADAEYLQSFNDIDQISFGLRLNF